tara:strand:+ start:5013 stop:6098 length:1086 start_codon:yes stop_codon:yes gene_type:complete
MNQKKNNKICFRVDSSNFIGIGHIKRSINIALSLQEAGFEPMFLTKNFEQNNYSDIAKAGFKNITINSEIREDTYLKNEKNWLCCDWQEDASKTYKELKSIGCSIIFIDHYGVSSRWESYLKNKGIYLIALDDIGRDHVTDILIDYSFWKSKSYFKNITDKTLILSGKDFLPLDRKFENFRHKSKNFKKPNILISTGGFDNEDLTEKVIKCLNRKNINTFHKVTIIVNKNVKKTIEKALSLSKFKYEVHYSPNALGQFYSESDVCIGSSGVSALERVYFQIPQLILVKANNQFETAMNLEIKNMALVEKNLEYESIKSSIDQFLNKTVLKMMHQHTIDFFNLDGTRKIASEISKRLQKNND